MAAATLALLVGFGGLVVALWAGAPLAGNVTGSAPVVVEEKAATAAPAVSKGVQQ